MKWFGHGEMVARQDVGVVSAALGRGRHFFDGTLPWQGGAGETI